PLEIALLMPTFLSSNQMLLLNRAIEELEKEKLERDEEKVRYLGEKMPALQLSGLSLAELQNLCKQLHAKIDIVDEERFDCESKAMSGMEGRKKMFDAAGGGQ
uniref:Troponin I, skeletal, slow d n=1 Tax=Pygocentrus nattereri TaxID=42514 RepID=A0AAR2LIA7_PYGNA